MRRAHGTYVFGIANCIAHTRLRAPTNSALYKDMSTDVERAQTHSLMQNDVYRNAPRHMGALKFELGGQGVG